LQDSIAGIAAANQEIDQWIKNCFAEFERPFGEFVP